MSAKKSGYFRDGSFKYGNKKYEVNGIKFDSKREGQRYAQLLLLEKAGEISQLERQKKFELIPAQKNAMGKVAEYACCYYADFVYQRNGKMVVEDAKGFRTPEYIIKRKLMRYILGISVQEV